VAKRRGPGRKKRGGYVTVASSSSNATALENLNMPTHLQVVWQTSVVVLRCEGRIYGWVRDTLKELLHVPGDPVMQGSRVDDE
jgi:hypothetical protein